MRSKTGWIFLAMLIALVLLEGGAAAAQPPAPAASPSVEEQLIDTEKQTWVLYGKKDARGLSELVSDDFYNIYADGTVVDKKQWLADMKDLTVDNYSLSDFKVVRLSEDAAIVVYKARAKGAFKDKKIESQVVVTSAWARREGRWLNVFYRENVLELNGRKCVEESSVSNP